MQIQHNSNDKYSGKYEKRRNQVDKISVCMFKFLEDKKLIKIQLN